MNGLEWRSYAGTNTQRAWFHGFNYIVQSANGNFWSSMICFGDGGKYCVTDVEEAELDDAKLQCQLHANTVTSALQPYVDDAERLTEALEKVRATLRRETLGYVDEIHGKILQAETQADKALTNKLKQEESK